MDVVAVLAGDLAGKRLVGNAVHFIITGGAGDLDGFAGHLGFHPGVDVHADVGFGEILAMQAAASNGIAHVAAQLAVCRAGVNVCAACPIAQGIDFGARVHALDIFGSGVALANDQVSIIQQVLAVAAIFFVKILTCTVLLIRSIIRHHNRPTGVLLDAAIQQS